MRKEKEALVIIPERKAETAREFGRAGKGSSLLHTVFHQLLKDTKDPSRNNRLISRLLEVLQSDPVNELGKRTIELGDLSLLEGFDFYKQHPLLRLLPVSPLVGVDRKKGSCHVSVAPFVPLDVMPGNINMTHIAFDVAVAEVDFRRGRFLVRNATSEPVAIHEKAHAKLSTTVPEGSSLPILVVVGIRFLKVVNGKAYPLAGRSLQLVKADTVIMATNKGKGRAAVRAGKTKKSKF